jgi:glutaminyl-peptide cyclotransferase
MSTLMIKKLNHSLFWQKYRLQFLAIFQIASKQYILLVGLLFVSATIFGSVEQLVPQIISILPHDPLAFTQGLAIHEGWLYESTGLYQRSTLRKINLKTGEVVEIKRLPDQYFAEGIAIIKDKIVQITWKEQQALIYDLHQLKVLNYVGYQGEGWGLCSDGQHIWMTSGTSMIKCYQLPQLTLNKQVAVTWNNQPVQALNDIECVEDAFYANIWKEDVIVRIDKVTGKVTGVIDASTLLTVAEKQKVGLEGVLNGIAYHPQKKTFLITGKFWPWLFEVKFVPKKSSSSLKT